MRHDWWSGWHPCHRWKAAKAAKARPEKNRTSSKDRWSMLCEGQWSSTPLPSRKGDLKQIGTKTQTKRKRTWQDSATKAIKPKLIDVILVPHISKYTRPATNVQFPNILFHRSPHCHGDLRKEVAVLYSYKVIESGSKVLSCRTTWGWLNRWTGKWRSAPRFSLNIATFPVWRVEYRIVATLVAEQIFFLEDVPGICLWIPKGTTALLLFMYLA